MTKRSKQVEALLAIANTLLSNDNVYISDLGYVKADSLIGQAFKQGVAEAIEHTLRSLNTYRGFRLLDKYKVTNFDRMYY